MTRARDGQTAAGAQPRDSPARAQRETSQLSPERQAALLDIVVSRLERVEAKARALRKATRQFGGDFALVDFTKAFDSPDEDDILAIQQVSGVFGSLVNSLVQPTPAAVKLLGLKPTPGMRGQPGFIDAVSQDGGFGADQATTLISLYQTRNALEHGSPDMQADELHGQVKLLLRSYKGLVKSFVIWLARNDVHLDDD